MVKRGTVQIWSTDQGLSRRTLGFDLLALWVDYLNAADVVFVSASCSL
jgi:hypothetical protein